MSASSPGPLPALTADELQALRAASLHPRDRALLETLAGCGLRPAELCALTLDDLDWHPERPPTLRLAGPTGQRRAVPLNAQVQDALRTWLEVRGTGAGEYLFCNLRSGARLSGRTMRKALVRCARRARVAAVSPRRLRHTFGLSLAASQVPLEQLFELLGSTSLLTAQRYLAASDRQKQAAVARLDRRGAFWRWLSRCRHQGFRFWGRPRRALRFNPGKTVGRQTERRRLETNLARGLDTLVLGAPGTGKSHLLALLTGERLVHLPALSPPKQAVLSLAEALHRQGVCLEEAREEAPGGWPSSPQLKEIRLIPAPAITVAAPVVVQQASLFEPSAPPATTPDPAADPASVASQVAVPAAGDFTAFLRRHGRTPLSGWVDLLLAAVPPRQWTLVIDDLTELTRQTARLLDRLGTGFTVFAAARAVHPKLATHFGRFDPLRLGNLDAADAGRLLRQATGNAPVEDWPQLEAHLWEQTAGNPRALLDSLSRLTKEPAITRQTVRDFSAVTGQRPIDLTPLVVLPLLVLIAFRFIARGLGDTELYVFAGVGSVLAMGLRFYLFRAR